MKYEDRKEAKEKWRKAIQELEEKEENNMAQYTKGIDSKGMFYLGIANGIQLSPVFRTAKEALEYAESVERGKPIMFCPADTWNDEEDQEKEEMI